ncbi:MAG TPA: hypothetical protein VK934_04025 [Fimbriimonas sp.]|nr:hypothetical protein [Fimbriimonas sp.]
MSEAAKKKVAEWLGVSRSALSDWTALLIGEARTPDSKVPSPVLIEQWASTERGELRIRNASIVACTMFISLFVVFSFLKGTSEADSRAMSMGVYTGIFLGCVIAALLLAPIVSWLCGRQVPKRILVFVFLAAVSPALPLIALANLGFQLGKDLPGSQAAVGAVAGLAFLVGVFLGPTRAIFSSSRYIGSLPCPKHAEPGSCPQNCRLRAPVGYWSLVLLVGILSFLLLSDAEPADARAPAKADTAQGKAP